jgi:hypothetical protein
VLVVSARVYSRGAPTHTRKFVRFNTCEYENEREREYECEHEHEHTSDGELYGYFRLPYLGPFLRGMVAHRRSGLSMVRLDSVTL